MKSINKFHPTIFEQIKRIDEQGQEFWSSRDLWKVLEYTEYRHFLPVIDKAKEACINSHQVLADHFEDFLEMVCGAKEIHAKKGLKKSQKILDHMGSTELAANLFRATQAEEKLKREEIKGKTKANKAHYEVGAKVRQTIKELGGTMPEDLPVAENIAKIESKQRKQLKGGGDE